MVKNYVVIGIKKDTLERLKKLEGEKVVILSKYKGLVQEKTMVSESHDDVIKKLLDFFEENGLIEKWLD